MSVSSGVLVGRTKVLNAQARIRKEEKFLNTLDINCTDDGVKELLLNKGKLNEAAARRVFMSQAREVSEGKRDTITFSFTDKKGEVPAVKVAKSLEMIAACQKTIRKYGGEVK